MVAATRIAERPLNARSQALAEALDQLSLSGPSASRVRFDLKQAWRRLYEGNQEGAYAMLLRTVADANEVAGRVERAVAALERVLPPETVKRLKGGQRGDEVAQLRDAQDGR
jgi:hypothetical protein